MLSAVKDAVRGDTSCREAGSAGDAERIRELAEELHRMAQPMMALQCRLEIGAMTRTADAYREAVVESMLECDRLVRSMTRMRETIARALELRAVEQR